ncbi:MAG: hypothetical protein ACYC61_05030 [Isosphaeraceae bacterium]
MTHAWTLAVVLATGPSNPGTEKTVVRVFVRPAPAPRPALKYELLPDVGELRPGNPAQNYVKCFMEQRPFFYSKQGVAMRTRYRTTPLVELRLDRTTEHYDSGGLRQADWAARLDALDWQARDRIQEGALETLPAEVGPLQVLGETLQARFRVEMAWWRHDDAIRTAKTMLALGRHLGEHPSEVGNLVGLGTAHLALDSLEEMVQLPGCPNLYWALTDLPSPLVDVRKGVQGERALVATALRAIRDDAPMTEAELDAVMARLSGLLSYGRERMGQPPRSLRLLLRALARDEARVRAARRALIGTGLSLLTVVRFPAAQVILVDAKRRFEIASDEQIKLLGLPVPDLNGAVRGDGATPERDNLFADLLPHIDRLRRTQASLDQQVALLRHVEALRLHAAAHGGRLPVRLSEVAVPLPLDPATGKPFEYQAEGATAHLRGGSPGEGSAVHYVVTMAK